MLDKLVPGPFIKIKIEHNSRSTFWNVTKFVFIVCPSRGPPKYIKTKVLTACFYFVQTFLKKFGTSLPTTFYARLFMKNISYAISY